MSRSACVAQRRRGIGVHSGAQRVLAAVTYTNIVRTDTTNGVSTAVPDASRVFCDV